MIKGGQVIEQGTFNELIARKGHLASLIGEHVEVIKDPEENEESENPSSTIAVPPAPRRSFLSQPGDNRRPSHDNHLTPTQVEYRRRLSVASHNLSITNDDNLVKHIENHQLTIVSNENATSDPIKAFERTRLASFVSNSEEEEAPMPEDAAPMKLVLEDQSILYKESPIWSYLKAGNGVIITLVIFIYFFVVHVIRILSGNFMILFLLIFKTI